MKLLLFLTMLSTGITLASDWRTEENLAIAKPLAMDYFWKQPQKVSGQDVVDAVKKFEGKKFFSWQDDRRFTFMHVLACETDNTALFRSVLGLGNSLQSNSKGNSPRSYPNCRPEMKRIVREYENEFWGSSFEDVSYVLSEEAQTLFEERATQQKLDEKSTQQKSLIVLIVALCAAYYGWNNYNSRTTTRVTV